MKTPRRSLFLALPVVALSLAACGGPEKGAVAVIKADSGDIQISEAQYERFFKAANQQTQQKEKPTALVAPDFKACVDERRKALPKDSQRKSGDAELRKQCSDLYEQVRNLAMSQLANLNWIKGEAERRDIVLRKAEVNRELSTIIRQQFQNEKGYDAFLKQSGFTRADVDLNIVADLAQKKITTSLQEDAAEPSEGDLKAYFESKKKTYTQPETRDLRLIKTADEAKAKEAKAALEAGRSWTEVAKKFSNDPATKDQGGKVLQTTADQQPPEFAGTVFKASKNQLLGPIKTTLGWYVVKVQNITAAKPPVYAELKDQLKQALVAENQQKALQDFKLEWETRWEGRTVCASKFDDLTVCDGKDPKPGTTPEAQQNAQRPDTREGQGLPDDAARRPVAESDAAAQQQMQQQVAAG